MFTVVGCTVNVRVAPVVISNAALVAPVRPVEAAVRV
jgi:hypothetical protein